MKKLLVRLLIAIAITLSLSACFPLLYPADDDVVIDYYTPGYYYYGGHYHSHPYVEYNRNRGYRGNNHPNHGRSR
jgi:hypothetical protein